MHYALKNRYPVETERQVKTACDYFSHNLNRFAPNDRVTAACNIEKRASELKVPISNAWVTNYSRVMKNGASYSPDFSLSMNMRKEACATHHVRVWVGGQEFEGAEIVDRLIKHASEISPIETLKAIEEFDKLANLEYHYDTLVPDPYMTVYGSHRNAEWDAVKVAGDKTDYDVVRASRQPETMEKVASVFGKGFAAGFAKEPVKTTEGMKDAEKEILGGTL